MTLLSTPTMQHGSRVAEWKWRQQQVRERERVQDQLRDRSGRQRGTEAETDSERRGGGDRACAWHCHGMTMSSGLACPVTSCLSAGARGAASLPPSRGCPGRCRVPLCL